jgi:hypothetical protein
MHLEVLVVKKKKKKKKKGVGTRNGHKTSRY